MNAPNTSTPRRQANLLGLVMVLLLLGGVVVFAQQVGGGHTTTVSIRWDDYATVLGEDPADWKAWVDFELRQDEAVVDSQSSLSDCEAAPDPDVWQCGTSVEATWSGLDAGQYEVWTRLRWTDGSQEIFGFTWPRIISDTQHFWLYETFVVQPVCLPLVMTR